MGSGRPWRMEQVDSHSKRKSWSGFSYAVLSNEFSDRNVSLYFPVVFEHREFSL